MKRGAWIILVFVLLGIAAGVFNVWWNASLTQRTKEFWGVETCLLMRRAPLVTVAKLTTNWPVKPNATYEGVEYEYDGKKLDLMNTPGMVHFRYAWISDDQYDWSAASPAQRPLAEYEYKFIDSGRRAVVLVNETMGWAWSPDRPGCVKLGRLLASLPQFRTVAEKEAARQKAAQ